MYTKEQLMPKRLSEVWEELISKELYWIIRKRDNVCMKLRWIGGGFDWNFNDHENIAYVIPVPGAPDECKPVAYPANKPSEDGIYLTHSKNFDEWKKAGWWGVMV